MHVKCVKFSYKPSSTNVGAGLRGMPTGIHTVDLMPVRCLEKFVRRGTETPPYNKA